MKKKQQYCEKCNTQIREGEESFDKALCQICWEYVCATSFWKRSKFTWRQADKWKMQKD